MTPIDERQSSGRDDKSSNSKEGHAKKIRFALVTLPLLLAGCATITDPQRLVAERASCERMENHMGLDQVHDHQALKGQGLNPMNLTHERCKKLLANTDQ